jgi:putative transposase
MLLNVRAIHVDGGSEFYSEYEQECQRTGIKLFLLPPKNAKLNGCVERAQKTHTEEFYEVNDCPWTIHELNKELSHWQYI